jgi:hypothetical protein
MKHKKLMKYKSYRDALRRRLAERKSDAGSFWADYRPRRDFGVFANVGVTTYKHNGQQKIL